MVLLRLVAVGALAVWSAFPPPADGQAARIENIASVSWRDPGDVERHAQSNRVSLDIVAPRGETVIGFRAAPPDRAGDAAAICGPSIAPAAVSAEALAAAAPIRATDGDGAVIVTLSAPAENRVADRRETATVMLVSGATGMAAALTETAPGSGMFAGVVPLGRRGGCGMALDPAAPLDARFPGSDVSRPSAAILLVDPGGRTFDSRTGALVDGSVVTLLDAAGGPAAVLGDDGVSRYPARVVSGAAVTDAGGHVYPPSPGRYRFPLVTPGRYTLRIEPPPGYDAPSTVDRALVAAVRDPGGRPFVLNNASYGGVLAVTADAPFVADVPLDHAGDAGQLLLEKIASTPNAEPGDVVQYRLTLTNRGDAPSGPIDLRDAMPPGLVLRPSPPGDAPAPHVSDGGHTLDFALPPLGPRQRVTIRYLAGIAAGTPPGELVNRAQALTAGRPASNEAMAAIRVHALLTTDALIIVGRVTVGACDTPDGARAGAAGIRLLVEDGTYAITDRDGAYHIEGVPAGRHVVALDTASLPPGLAVQRCGSDTRAAGSATSCFVEGVGGLVRRIDFRLVATGHGDLAETPPPAATADDAAAAGNRDWLRGQSPGIGWLFPGERHNPRAPVLRIVIKHRPGDRVALIVNGRPTDPLAFDATDVDRPRGVAVSRWSGVPLVAGVNRLEARVLDGDGHVVATLDRIVTVAGPPAAALVDPVHSRLVADGRSTPLLAVRVTDRDGNPVRDGTLVRFAVDPPYAAALDAALDQRRQLAGGARTGPLARVTGDDGLALLALQPTMAAGAVRARALFTDDRGNRRESDLRGWLVAPAAPWTVVGFGAGTIGHDVIARHLTGVGRTAASAPITSGELALYAKGRVRGAWLLTIAYASARRYDPDRGPLGTIDPNRYYTVYADGSLEGQDAPTGGKLYVRLERREAYALFGDIETGFDDSVLGRYQRTLTGFKAAYEGRRFRAAAFAANTRERYGRDELRGTGLSGPYQLAARTIVPNSDRVRIEVRDRLRPERIVSSTQMARHIDYDIDPDFGTLRFRAPVLSRDAALNPTVIVVDYEVENGALRKPVAGIRAAGRAAGGRIEAGVTALRDDTVGRATLLAADVKLAVTATSVLRGEIAAGGRGGLGAGRAFLVEGEHHGGRLDLLAYARQQDGGFGVGQQDLVEAGTRKVGADVRLRLTDRLSLAATGWHQAQLAGVGTRTALDARLDWRTTQGSVFGGIQLASDRGLDGRDRVSRLVTLGGSRLLLDGRLSIEAQTQIAPGGAKASVDFPVRHVVTASLRVRPALRLIAGYEIADGAASTARTARVGVDLAPWTGGSLLATLNRQAADEHGQRTYAQYAVTQSLPLGRRWRIDATLDAARTVSGREAAAAITPFQPIAPGTTGTPFTADQGGGDHIAATLGATYRIAAWSWTGRAEYRDGAADDRYGLTTSVLRALGEGRSLAAGVRAYRLRGARGNGIDAAGDVALALRSGASRWAVLDRLSVRRLDADAGVGIGSGLALATDDGVAGTTTRIVNDLAVSYRTRPADEAPGTEVTVYYGAKYVVGRLADEVSAGFIDVTGFDLRRDLGRRFDIGVQGSVQHSWGIGGAGGGWAWSGGPSVGVSPAGNIWISAGFNLSGYRDRDFAADRYTRAGPYLTLRAKVDRRALVDAAHALFGGRG